MKKSINRVMIMLLAFVSALCFVFAIATANLKITKAATTQEVEPQFSIVKSAQVYTGAKDDSTGIRFSATLNSQWLSQKVQEIGDETPIYFGIELSVDNNKDTALDFCYTASQDGITGFKKIDFEKANEFTYNAALMYNKKTLATELFDRHSDSFETLEDFMQSALFEKYLQAAYKTEITAVAYYQVGGTEVAKNYIGDSATYSIFGVGSKVYSGWDSELDGSLTNDETGDFILVGKYFSSASKVDAKVYLQENGEIIGYNAFNETDLVYVNAKPTEVEEYETGKFKIKDTSMLDGIDVRDKKVITIATISDAGVLTTVQADYVTMIIDEASDFEVFDLDETYTLQDGTTKIGEVVNGYYIMTEDIDAEGTNLGLDHTFSTRYNVSNGILLNGFTGVFDGQGHVIKNFVPGVGGLFGRLAQGSSVYGIGFYNATLAKNTNLIAYNGNSYQKVDNSQINASEAETTYGGMTLLERNNLIKDRTTNIYINDIYAQLSSDTTEVNGVITKNDQYDSEINHNNIVIDASKCIVGQTYSFFLYDSGGMMNTGYLDSIVVISNKGNFRANATNKFYGTNQGKTAGDGVIVSNNVYVYNMYADFINDSEITAKFKSTVWDTENGVVFKALKDKIYQDNIGLKDEDNNLYFSTITSDNTQLTLTAVDVYGNALTLNNFTSTDNAVIDYVDGVIKVVDFAEGQYTVSFNVPYGEETINCTYVINLTVETITVASEAIYDSTENKVYYRDEEGNKQIISDGTFTFVKDASTEYVLTAGSSTQKFKGAVVLSTTRGATDGSNYGVLTGIKVRISTGIDSAYEEIAIPYSVKNSDYTGVSIKVNQGNKVYLFTDTVFATAVIDDGLELKNTFNKPDTYDNTINAGIHGSNYYGNITLGVYMLADNINADKNLEDGFKFDNSYLNIFDGILDGRGYSIFNLDVSGTESKPGNGLFSDTTDKTVIQNIGFIDVVANYGSVFMGNRADANGTYGTYGLLYSDSWKGDIGMTQYRSQVGIADDDTTTPITNYLTNTSRRTSSISADASWVNVYVKVHKDTKRLMGVISRQMTNGYDSLSAFNLVIEYLPDEDKLYDVTNGDGSVTLGALPAGYAYTNGEYGVLFGGTYTLSALKVDESATKTFFTPTGMSAKDWANRGALNFVCAQSRTYSSVSNKIYVISQLGLVSTTTGSILGTNEEVSSTNPYKFFVPKGSHCLERYDSYSALQLANKTAASMSGIGTGQIGEGKLWSFANGTLVWNNSTLA